MTATWSWAHEPDHKYPMQGDETMSPKAVRTYYLRKVINQLVESSLEGPSLGEMVRHHLRVEWQDPPPPLRFSHYRVYDRDTVYWEIAVTDRPVYNDLIYLRGLALITIGVNGSLVTPAEESQARALFPHTAFRTCRLCGEAFDSWIDYYGHKKMSHWLDSQSLPNPPLNSPHTEN